MSTSLTPPEPRPRVTTIVWGVVLLIIPALILAGQFFAISIDPVILTLGLLVGVGLSLVIGGIFSLRARHPAGADRDRSDTGTDDIAGYWEG